jgi:amino acid permease
MSEKLSRGSPHEDALYSDKQYVDPPPEESLRRDLKARQISMIALGGAIGTGCAFTSTEPFV